MAVAPLDEPAFPPGAVVAVPPLLQALATMSTNPASKDVAGLGIRNTMNLLLGLVALATVAGARGGVKRAAG
jgi:hypothetical protein